MFLRTNVTNRRQFIGRSALGAGSLLFAPLLLESCTDHIIPDPKPNPTHLPSEDVSLDDELYWYDQAKSVITTGLGLQPEAGGFLGSLLNSLWPRNVHPIVWQLALGQMEVLLGQQIQSDTYTNAINALSSIKDSINDYLTQLNYGTPEQINDKWEAATDQFVDSQLFFKVSGYEELLLPLFAQFVNLYLSLLRDAVAFGQSWGRSDSLHQTDIQTLQGYISGAVQYVTSWYNTGWYDVSGKAGNRPGYGLDYNEYFSEPFRSVNQYVRVMTLLVLDFRDIWPYFDITLYPNGVTPVISREIYSDPFGPSTNLILPPSSPTQFPTQLSVWAGNRINAVQLTYPAGSGPGGAAQTPRMGDPDGGSNQAPAGTLLTLSPDNPITQFRVVSQVDAVNYVGPFVMAMQFQYYDGTLASPSLLGGQALPSDYETRTHPDGSLIYEVTSWLSYGPYEALSSIFVSGSDKDDSNTRYVTGVVLGFKLWQPPK